MNEVFDGKKLGDAPTDPNITRCVTDPSDVYPLNNWFVGRGEEQLQKLLRHVGTAIGANLISGGRGYTRPPFVTINDIFLQLYLNRYSNIDDDPSSPTFGQVTDIIYNNSNGSRKTLTETNPNGGTTGPRHYW